MQQVPFYKIHPSGNMTCLFEGLHFTAQQRHTLANKALQKSHIDGEQAGFIDIAQGFLHMAGGELCINATRSLGLLMALRAGCHQEGNQWQGYAQVSGADAPLYMEVIKAHKNSPHDVCLHMPLSPLPLLKELDEGIVLVTMPGIVHMLIDAKLHPFNKQSWQEDSAAWREKFQLTQHDAVGCIWWQEQETSIQTKDDKSQTAQALHIDPVVFVKNPPTLCYENACGSGTLAVTLWLHTLNKQHSFFVTQPGGHLSVTYHAKGHGLMARISGPVYVVAQGHAFFTMDIEHTK